MKEKFIDSLLSLQFNDNSIIQYAFTNILISRARAPLEPPYVKKYKTSQRQDQGQIYSAGET